MYPTCIKEDDRLRVLRDLEVIGTPPEKAFDVICRTARRLFGAPIVLVSLVEHDRQWFKARCGLDVAETSREVSFCSYAILNDDVMVVENALEDERFSENPLVLGPPSIRFYAGAPLVIASGIRVGTLCVIDDAPRSFSAGDREMLADLAEVVTGLLSAHRGRAVAQAEVEARRSAESLLCAERNRAMRTETMLREVIETIPDAVATYDAQDRLLLCNSAYRRFYATSAPAIRLGASFEDLLRYGLEHGQYADAGTTAEEQQAWLARRLEAHRRGTDGRVLQRLDDGRWLQITERRSESGHLVGVRTDVTELKLAELEVRRAAETDALIRSPRDRIAAHGIPLANRDV